METQLWEIFDSDNDDTNSDKSFSETTYPVSNKQPDQLPKFQVSSTNKSVINSANINKTSEAILNKTSYDSKPLQDTPQFLEHHTRELSDSSTPSALKNTLKPSNKVLSKASKLPQTDFNFKQDSDLIKFDTENSTHEDKILTTTNKKDDLFSVGTNADTFLETSYEYNEDSKLHRDSSSNTQITHDPEFPESLHLNYTVEKQKYEEDESTAKWYKHKLHILIFTYSGKPVYTRYGSEERMTAFTGTLAAILTTMQSLFHHSEDSDHLRYMKAGQYIFAFIQRGPLWLAAISSKNEYFSQMEALLNNVHLQILSLLTRTIEQALTVRPSYDLRKLLGGTDGVIYNYISWHLKDMFSLVKGFEPLPLNPASRSISLNILKDVQSPNILAGILFAQHRIVAISTSKSIKLPPSDIILLLNLVLSSASLRQAESWMPVCLPGINDGGFLYAYVNFLTIDTVGVIFISTNSDPEQFYTISQHFKRIHQIVTSSNCLNDIHASIKACPLPIDPNLTQHEIIHMLCFSTPFQQYFSSNFRFDYQTKEKKRRIIRLYSQCNFLIRNLKTPAHLYLKGEIESVYIWKVNDFHLYLCIPRWKNLTSYTLTLITEWIKSNLNTLFIISIPSLTI